MMRAESTAILEAGLECLKKTQFVPESSEDGSVVCHETEAEFKAAFLEQVVNENLAIAFLLRTQMRKFKK